MDNKRTSDMIDADLVEKISGYIPCSITGNTHYVAQRGIIAEVLAWLANNPITPTEEQIQNLYGRHMDHIECPVFSSRKALGQTIGRFQRIAYLKPEPVYPTELHQKMWTQGYGGITKSQAEEHNQRLKEAFELGKESR